MLPSARACARRASGAAADQVRAGGQSQGREGALGIELSPKLLALADEVIE